MIDFENEQNQIDAIIQSGIGDPERFQALSRARLIAKNLLDNWGHLPDILKTFGQNAGISSIYQEHQIAILEAFHTNKQFYDSLMTIHLPANNSLANTLIRYSLQLPKTTVLTDRHAQEAALSAALVPLRQNVGSCFATAPGIFVQRYQLEVFFADLKTLIATGQLTRIISGEPFSVPLSPHWGEGDLDQLLSNRSLKNPAICSALQGTAPITSARIVRELFDEAITTSACGIFKSYFDHALLKAWEFTLASFCEYKVEFYHWNLIAGLGLNLNEVGGVGQVIYQKVSEHLDRANEAVAEHQKDMDEAYGQLKISETHLRSVSSPSQAHRLQATYKLHAHQFTSSERLRDEAHLQAKQYAELLNFAVKQYRQQFQDFFQEVYDVGMRNIRLDLYDDSPAGFRLVYKYGRTDPNLWTKITNEEDYLTALLDFFQVCEARLTNACDIENASGPIGEITTAIIQHIQTQAFIESAYSRVLALHKKARMGSQNCTPWSYISGGSMEHLLKGYFCLDELPKEEMTPKSALDLLVFFIETLKNAPNHMTSRPLFAYSPSHAFLLLPQLQPFKEAWLSKEFTYTWVRDRYLLGAQDYYHQCLLSPSDQATFIRFMGLKNVEPKHIKLTPKEFRDFLVEYAPAELIDGKLIEFLPRSEATQPLFFADSNWPGLWFAFAVNPGTNELDLWRSDPAFLSPRPMHMWRSDLDGTSKASWGIFLRQF